MALPAGASELIVEILQGKDLTKTSLKEVRSELETRLSLGPGALDSCRDEIKQLTTAEIARIQEEESAASAAADLEDGAQEGEDDAAVASASSSAGAGGAAASAAATAPSAPASARKGKKRAAEQTTEKLEGQEGAGGKGKSKGPGTKEKQKKLMSRKKFLETAEAFKVKVGEKIINVPPRVFSTNSCGFFTNSKISMKVGDQDVMVQCQINCTVIGSKEWAAE